MDPDQVYGVLSRFGLVLPLFRTHENEPQHDGEFAEHHRENPIRTLCSYCGLNMPVTLVAK